MAEQSPIEISFQVYAEESGETFGAVHGLVPQTNPLVIYISRGRPSASPLWPAKCPSGPPGGGTSRNSAVRH